jgi:hypothetical protein
MDIIASLAAPSQAPKIVKEFAQRTPTKTTVVKHVPYRLPEEWISPWENTKVIFSKIQRKKEYRNQL